MESTSSFVGIYDINGLPQGTDFTVFIDYQVGSDPVTVDLTSYTGKLQVRRNFDNPVLLELTSVAGEITFDSIAPNISVAFPAIKTSTMTIYEDMLYDLQIISPGGLTSRIIQGCFSLDRQITE